MEPGSISVARTLPIDSTLAGEMVLRLRRDAPGSSVRWTLGDRGLVEVDVNFTSAPAADVWSAPARIWHARHGTAARVTLRITTTPPDAVHLTLEPDGAVSGWWKAHLPELLDATHAAVDELAEELLWHASRAGVGAGSR